MTTPFFECDEMIQAQSQPHTIFNKDIRRLEAGIGIDIVDKDLFTPPTSPVITARYIVAATATGAWLGKEGKIAFVYGSAWAFLTPRAGWRVWVVDEERYYRYTGTAWTGDGVDLETSGSPVEAVSGAKKLVFSGNVTITETSPGVATITIAGGSEGGGISGVGVTGAGSPGQSISLATSLVFDGLCEVSQDSAGVARITVFGDGGGSGGAGGGISGVNVNGVGSPGQNVSAATTIVFDGFAEVTQDSDGVARVTVGSGNPPQGSVNETIVVLTSVAGVLTIDHSRGSFFTVTLSENVTSVVHSGVRTGEANAFTLRVLQNGVGGFTFAEPSSWLYPSGVAVYTASSGANDIDSIQGMTYDNGVTWHIDYAKDYV